MSLNDKYAAAKSPRVSATSGANIVLYARQKDGVTDDNAVKALFPGWELALSYHSILTTVDYYMKPVRDGGKFPNSSADVFVAVAMALG